MSDDSARTEPERPGAREILRILGEMDALKLAAIEAAGASLDELDQVAAWLAGQDDAMGELRKPLTGAAAQLYDILTADEAEDEDR
jgi:hypothetical protein